MGYDILVKKLGIVTDLGGFMNRKNYSAKREAIYNAICSTKIHPSAEWIYNNLRPQIPNLSLGTVYRNINVLCDEGKIKSVGTVNGIERFDGDTSYHAHFICNDCGCIIDIEQNISTYCKRLEDIVKETVDLDICGHSIQFYGRCNACKASNNARKLS